MATTKRTRPTSRRPAPAKAQTAAKPKTPAKPKAPAKPRATRSAAKSSVIPSAHTLGISAIVVGLGAALAGAVAWLRARTPGEGHAAPDLEGDTHPGPDSRAPAHFRPDMDAPMSAADREALRPATLDG